MTSRADVIESFLAGTPAANWRRHPLAGDASARRYERLAGPNGQTMILMDSPVETNGSIMPFVDIAQWLSTQGLCPPNIESYHTKNGLILMSDLGRVDLAQIAKKRP